jgi:hypothetical protein
MKILVGGWGVLRMATVSLHVKIDNLPTDNFKDCIDSFVLILKSLAKEASPDLFWRFSVEKGSLVTNAELAINSPIQRDVFPMYKEITQNLSILTGGKSNSRSLPSNTTSEYKKLLKAIGNDSHGSPRGEIIMFDRQSKPEILSLCQPATASLEELTHKEIGSVTGRIGMLSVYKRNTFGMYDEATGTYVKGKFDDKLLAKLTSSFNVRVSVGGILTYDDAGKIKFIEAKSIYRKQSPAPHLFDMFGIAEA